MASQVNIPLEILELIINKLRNNRDALLQCSLASRAFLRPSHRQLFYRISICEQRKCRAFKGLLQILPSIASFVQELLIIVDRGTTGSGWVAEDLTCVLQPLYIHLHTFQISTKYGLQLSFDSFPFHLQSALLVCLRLPNLANVAIGSITKFPVAHFATCPQLKYLKISLPDVNPTVSLVAPIFRDVHRGGGLEMLHISTTDAANALVDALVHPFSQLHLSSLLELLITIGDVEANAAGKIINASQSSLQELYWFINEMIPRGIYLGEFGSLTTVKLSIFLGRTIRQDPLDWLAESLEKGSFSHPLKMLHLSVIAPLTPRREFILENFWACFDSTLSQLRYACLQSVHVQLHHFTFSTSRETGNRELVNTVFGAMPLLCARGVLQVDSK